MREPWAEPLILATAALAVIFSIAALATSNAIWGAPAGISAAGAWILWSKRDPDDPSPGF